MAAPVLAMPPSWPEMARQLPFADRHELLRHIVAALPRDCAASQGRQLFSAVRCVAMQWRVAIAESPRSWRVCGPPQASGTTCAVVDDTEQLLQQLREYFPTAAFVAPPPHSCAEAALPPQVLWDTRLLNLQAANGESARLRMYEKLCGELVVDGSEGCAAALQQASRYARLTGAVICGVTLNFSAPPRGIMLQFPPQRQMPRGRVHAAADALTTLAEASAQTLTKLEVSGPGIDDSLLLPFVRHLTGLESLSITLIPAPDDVTDAVIDALGLEGFPSRLPIHTLHLFSVPGVSSGAVARLLGRLRVCPASLRALTLRHCPDLGDEAIRCQQTATWSALQEIDVSHSSVTDRGLVSIIPFCAGTLTSLAANGCCGRIGDRTVCAIATFSGAAVLRTLSIRGACGQLTDAGVSRLLRSPASRGLRCLELGSNPSMRGFLTTESLAPLLSQPTTSTFEYVSLFDNRSVTCAFVTALIVQHAGTLRKINIGRCRGVDLQLLHLEANALAPSRFADAVCRFRPCHLPPILIIIEADELTSLSTGNVDLSSRQILTFQRG